MPTYSKSVLLIDDDPADRKLFSRLLRKAGFDVIEALSPEGAMSSIVRGAIGCVVTDQMMPVPGVELVETVKQVRADIGIVFISGGQPKPGLPENATFVSKDDRAALVRAVEACMVQWRSAGKDVKTG